LTLSDRRSYNSISSRSTPYTTSSSPHWYQTTSSPLSKAPHKNMLLLQYDVRDRCGLDVQTHTARSHSLAAPPHNSTKVSRKLHNLPSPNHMCSYGWITGCVDGMPPPSNRGVTISLAQSLRRQLEPRLSAGGVTPHWSHSELQVKSSQVASRQVKSSHSHSSEVKPHPVQSSPVQSRHVASRRVTSRHVTSRHVRSGPRML